MSNLGEGLFEQGFEQGVERGRASFIRHLLDIGRTPGEIHDWLDISMEAIQKVQEQIANGNQDS